MNKDRGIIKWKPFESLTPNKTILESILKEKQKSPKPILSLEQLTEIEEKIMEAYYEQIPITLKFYQSGFIETITTTILYINSVSKKIGLEKNKEILFKQIVEIIL